MTPLEGGQNETPVAVLRIWQAWDEVPDDKTHVDLLVINSFWQAGVTECFPAVCRYSPDSFIYADPNRGTRSRRESWVLFWRGVTESGALDSSLSFLNRLSVGKAMANARPGVKLQTKRLSRATARLRRVTAWILPKPRCKGKAHEWTTVTHGAQLIVDWSCGAGTPTSAPDSLSSIRLVISQGAEWWLELFIILVIHSCFPNPLLTHQPCRPPKSSIFVLNSCPVSCPLCEMSVNGEAPGSGERPQERSWPPGGSARTRACNYHCTSVWWKCMINQVISPISSHSYVLFWQKLRKKFSQISSPTLHLEKSEGFRLKEVVQCCKQIFINFFGQISELSSDITGDVIKSHISSTFLRKTFVAVLLLS